MCIICPTDIPLFSELSSFNTGSEEHSASGREEGEMQASAGGWRRRKDREEDSVTLAEGIKKSCPL